MFGCVTFISSATGAEAWPSDYVTYLKHDRLTSGELLSNDRLAPAVASHGLVRLALA